jgi:hypothetical protein
MIDEIIKPQDIEIKPVVILPSYIKDYEITLTLEIKNVK